MVDGDASPTGPNEMNDESASRDLVAIQAKPDLLAWRLWKRAILRVFTTTDKKAFKDITQQTLRLRKPLGKWLHPFHKLKRSWKHAYSPSQDAIYSYVGNNQYSVHDDNVSTGRDAESYPIFRRSFKKTVFKLPLDCEPTGVIMTDETISLKRKGLMGVHRGVASYTPKVPARPEWAEHLPDWEWEILRCTQPCRARGISRHSKVAGDIEVASRKSDEPNYKRMLIVSDGSVRNNRGAFGWVLALPDGTRLVEGQGPAYGYEISSFRAEAYGMLSALRYIHHIAKHYNVPLPLKFRLCCDNQGLIKRVTRVFQTKRREFVNETLLPERDLIEAIVTTIRNLGHVQLEHVKGHQDSNKPLHQLPLPAQLNVAADHLAGIAQDRLEEMAEQYRTETTTPVHSVNPAEVLLKLPDWGSGTTLEPVLVTRKLRHTLREAVSIAKSYQQLQSEGWSPETFRIVDWEAFQSAVSNTRETRTFTIKLINDLLPTGKRVHLYKEYYDDRCPSCDSRQEDRDHLFQCQDAQRDQWRTQFVENMTKTMQGVDTSPDLKRLLTEGLMSYFHDTPYQLEGPEEIQHLALEQERIGWHQLLFGKFVKEWRTVQEAYLEATKTPLKINNHGVRWTCHLIHAIWREVRQLWDIRNEARHGKDKDARDARQYEQAVRETQWLYKFRDKCSPDAQRIIFHPSVEVHLAVENDLQKLQGWLQLQRKTILALVKPKDRPPRPDLLNRNRRIRRQQPRRNHPQNPRRQESRNPPSLHRPYPQPRKKRRSTQEASRQQMSNFLLNWRLSSSSQQPSFTSTPPDSTQSPRRDPPRVKMKR
jgi:ribonuclease HI